MINLAELGQRIDRLDQKVGIGRLKGDRVIKVDPNDALAVSRAMAAIADRYKAHFDQRVDVESNIPLIACLRIPELERYLVHRYGPVLPDDDAGRDDLVILLNHVAMNSDDPGGRMLGCIGKFAPWMDAAERLAVTGMILKKPRRYKAATLGKLLRLTKEEREFLQITTIRAFDATDGDMLEDTKRKDRERKTVKRRSDGVVPRAKYEANSKSKTEPWKALNMSRSTYYRKLAAGQISETGPSGPLEAPSYAPDTLVSRPVSRPIDLTGFDFATFGIVAIKVMSGTDIISEWRSV
jgi:hypothetical protein